MYFCLSAPACLNQGSLTENGKMPEYRLMALYPDTCTVATMSLGGAPGLGV